MENHETILKNHENQLKAMKNHETTLKKHGNQPKTMKNHENYWSKNVTSLPQGPNWPPLIQKRDVTNTGPQLTSFDPKSVTNAGPQPTSFDPKSVTNAGPQLTSFGPKTSRYWRGTQTDLLDV